MPPSATRPCSPPRPGVGSRRPESVAARPSCARAGRPRARRGSSIPSRSRILVEEPGCRLQEPASHPPERRRDLRSSETSARYSRWWSPRSTISSTEWSGRQERCGAELVGTVVLASRTAGRLRHRSCHESRGVRRRFRPCVVRPTVRGFRVPVGRVRGRAGRGRRRYSGRHRRKRVRAEGRHRRSRSRRPDAKAPSRVPMT